MKRIYLILLLFSSHLFASAEISIGTLYDYMSGQQSTYLKRIRNQGDATAFVKVAIHEITYDEAGQPHESREMTEGRRALIASPSRMIIPANGVQATRLLYMGSGTRSAISGSVLFLCCQTGGWVRFRIPIRLRRISSKSRPG